MKKSKFMLLLLVSIISFSFGVNYIKALPTCNIGYMDLSAGINNEIGYGTIQVRTGSWNNTTSSTPQIYSCPSSGNCSEWYVWRKERSFYFEARVPRGKILNVRYRFYRDTDGKRNTRDQAICDGELPASIENNEGTVTVSFNLTNGNLESAEIWVEYEDENGKKDELNTSRWVGKKLGEGQTSVTNIDSSSNDMTTKTTEKKPDAQEGSMWGDDGIAYSSSNDGSIADGGAAAGIGKATASKSKVDATINGETACNSINDMFDYFWPYVMIIIPILLIIMMSIDFFKSMISNDADAIKKAGSGAVKRTIAAVVLLALPVILRYIFGLFGLDFCL